MTDTNTITKRPGAAPEGVFFDLYGTLLVYGDMGAAWTGWLGSLHASLRSHGLAMSIGVLGEECNGFFSRPEPPPTCDGLTVYERRIRRLALGLGLELNSADIRRAANTAADGWHRHVTLDPDAPDVLRHLRQSKPLALISNFDHPPYVRRLLDKCGLTEFFDVVVVSGEVGIKKPDPGIFRLALDATGLRPSQVVHVGDTDEDILGARTAGIEPVLIRRGEAETEARALDFRHDRSVSTDVTTISADNVRTVRSLPEIFELIV